MTDHRIARRTVLAGSAIGGAALMTSSWASGQAIPPDRQAGGIRKSYVDTRLGQMHLRSLLPEAPTRPPLLCLHQTPSSAITYVNAMPLLAVDRPVYAPDCPGLGNSDIPAQKPSIADYADAMEELLDQLGHAQIDILGYHTGACIGTELALRRPQQVRRLVLNGLALFNADERAAFEAQPWPKPRDPNGDFVLAEWETSKFWRGKDQPLDSLVNTFVEKLRAGETAWWTASAVYAYPLAEKLPQISQKVLAIRAKDDLWDITPRARPLLTNAEWREFPDHGFGFWDAITVDAVGMVRDFLDA